MSEVHIESNPVGSRRVGVSIDNVAAGNSAVSWAAIFAGAAGAAALSLLLLLLGTGLGFSVVSPWAMDGIGVVTFGFATIAWVSFTQIAASGMGGYLAGRLRTKWASVHTDEVYFRDTAHGFLTWAVATLLTAALLTSVVGSVVGAGARAGAEVAGAVAGSAATLASGGTDSDESSDTIEYFVESLFRSDRSGSSEEGARQDRETSEIPAGEVTRIFGRALSTGAMPQEDERYIGRLIAQRTDLSQQDAELRVSEGFQNVQNTLDDAETTAREAADEARKASAYVTLWMFIALLIGAFTASLTAVYGGRQRDA